MNRTRIGALCELQACAWLLTQGYEVFRNVSPEGKVDIIARKDNKITLIDVKKAVITTAGNLYYHNSAIEKAKAQGIDILLSLPDGTCVWGSSLLQST